MGGRVGGVRISVVSSGIDTESGKQRGLKDRVCEREKQRERKREQKGVGERAENKGRRG